MTTRPRNWRPRAEQQQQQQQQQQSMTHEQQVALEELQEELHAYVEDQLDPTGLRRQAAMSTEILVPPAPHSENPVLAFIVLSYLHDIHQLSEEDRIFDAASWAWSEGYLAAVSDIAKLGAQ